MKKYASVIFLVLLGLTFILSIPAVTGAFMEKWDSTAGRNETEEATPILAEETVTPTEMPTPSIEGTSPTVASLQTEIPTQIAPKPTTPSQPVQFVAERGNFTTVDASYFDDALFIGDSRTDDLKKYGTLKNASYFASVGMSVYKIHSARINGQSLSECLHSRSFGKVYVMLGFNEAGYNKERTVGEMRKLFDEIRAAQPNALIFVEANLYVTKHTSETDKFEHNDEIRYLNNRFAEFADGQNVMYIDVNPLFCDSEGNLKEEMTGDGHHVYAKHYKTWCEWLKTRGVIKHVPTPVPTPAPTPAPTTEAPVSETPNSSPQPTAESGEQTDPGE